MTFFVQRDYGRLYVIKLVLPDGLVIFKVGMTHSDRVEDRMMEILRSWFSYYRFVPYAELKMSREVKNPRKLEKLAHKILKNCSWIPDKKIQGRAEMFTGLDENKLLHLLKHLEAGFEGENLEVLGTLLLEK